MRSSGQAGRQNVSMRPNASVRRVLHSMVSVVSGQGIVLIGNLVIVPFFLRAWGAEKYGVWLVASALVGYLATLDFGMNMYIANRLSQAWATGDLGQYRQVQSTAVGFFGGVAVIGSLLVGATGVLLRAVDLPVARGVNPGELVLTACLLAAQVLASLVGGVLVNTYRTVGSLPTTQWVSNAQRLVIVVGTLLLLIRHEGFVAVASLQLGVTATVIVAVLLHLRLRLPAAFPAVRGFRLAILRESLSPSGHFGLIVFGTALVVQGTSLMVAWMFGTAMLALVQATRTLANVIRQGVGVMGAALWPEFTLLEARGGIGRLRLLSRLQLYLASGIGVCGAAVLHFIGLDVLTAWTSGKLSGSQGLMDAIAVYVALQAPWMAASLVVVATNRHESFARRSILAGALGLALGFVFGKALGPAGVFLGLLVGEACVLQHAALRQACLITGEGYAALAGRLWGGLPVVAAAAYGCAMIADRLAPRLRAERWAAVMGAALCGTVLAGRVIWMRRGEWEAFRDGIGLWKAQRAPQTGQA